MSIDRATIIRGPAKVTFGGETFWSKSGATSCNYVELTRDLGEKYRMMEVGFKPASCCRYFQSAITAVWKALEGETVKAKDIEEVLLTQAILLPPVYEWDTMVQAHFSLPCAIAMSIAGGEPGIGWYKTGRFMRQDRVGAAAKPNGSKVHAN